MASKEVMAMTAPRSAVHRHEEGFTIVELLVAMAILIFVSVALLQTAIVNIDFNTRNALRDEATRLGGEVIDQLRNAEDNDDHDFLGIHNGTTRTEIRTVRNIPKKYAITNSVTPLKSPSGKYYSYRITVQVEWDWKGENYKRTVYTVRPAG